MRVLLAVAASFALCVGCGGSEGTSSPSGGSGGQSSSGSGGTTGATGGTPGTGGHVAGTGGHATGTGGHVTGTGGHGSGGATGSGGAQATGGATGGPTTVNDGGISATGNPNGSCKMGVPAAGMPVDVSTPTTVVGTGTAVSCTFSALNAAVAKAGIITFDCGSAPVTIPVTATMNLSTSKDTVIDGGGLVTLDGGHAVQILNFNHNDFQKNTTRVTLQNLALINGKATPTMPIADKNQAGCSEGYYDGQGGALLINDGNLTVINCLFDGNQAAQLGPDTGGGAIYIEGSLHGAIIVNSTFTNNNGSNGGAVGSLYGELDIYNTLLEDNTATGNGANYDDASKCSVTDAETKQHQAGSGGNGGAISADGNSFNILLCGDAVLNNAAGTKAFGGGLFFTSDDSQGNLTITDTTMTGNTGGSFTTASSGSKDAGSAVGIIVKTLTITNSMLQM